MGSMHCRRSITHPGSSRRRRSIMVRTSAISSDHASKTATGRISGSAGSLLVVLQDARFGEVIQSRHDQVSRNLCGAAAVNSYIGQPDEASSEDNTSELQSLRRISYAYLFK